MTKSTFQAAAVVLSALVSFGVIAGMNGIATRQYAKAEAVAMASSSDTAHVARQGAAGHGAA